MAISKAIPTGNTRPSWMDSLWYFHPGDLPGGKQSATGTTGWDTLHHTVFGNAGAPRQWRGMGWFGLWIRADTLLLNRKLFLSIFLSAF
ncbi:hypothetical protein SNE26_09315 [Mucilaginibacter sp. cycad4]|uniref:hypothetical protein n=1 Tax=Mucilaginibacter sp. cycad4 TaxID=3342096 RepID=UPI002AAAD9C7|nr:hypothetical protein [Mucilaginibacter gossypii]WPV01972.1 hypothetical protein SNE26_09315 [Mucilaginibacter gossypii]